MEHSPSREGNKSSSSQEIPCILWNLEVHHRIHKRPATVPNLSLINAVHVSSFHFFKIHASIIHIYSFVFQVASFLLVYILYIIAVISHGH